MWLITNHKSSHQARPVHESHKTNEKDSVKIDNTNLTMKSFLKPSSRSLFLLGCWSFWVASALLRHQYTRRATCIALTKLNSRKDSETVGSERQRPFGTYSAKYLEDNGLEYATDSEGLLTARPVHTETSQEARTDAKTESREDETADESTPQARPAVKEQPAHLVPVSGFNVVLTHCTCDFDSLASAVGLAKLWSSEHLNSGNGDAGLKEFDSSSHVPTFVVLPRGAHPSVQRFLALHKHLFPIRSLKSLPSDLSGLNRLGLVDAQRRDRIGPAEFLLEYAERITVVDHHLDADSDINSTDFILDKVGSVSTLIVERLMEAELNGGLTEAEATLLALGIHGDTGSLCYDSTTARDAKALAYVMEQGASQAAIAEHAHASLSREQQSVLTQALVNTNSTIVHGVTLSTVLLTADGFINGLAAVTQDALELSSSDIYLLGLVYEPRSGGQRKKKQPSERIKTHVLKEMEAAGLRSTEDELLEQKLRQSFEHKDKDNSGYLDKQEIFSALASSGIIASEDSVTRLLKAMDTDNDGQVSFQEFVAFSKELQQYQVQNTKRPCTLIIIGRVKAGVNMKGVKLGKLLERFGGGGHAKAASATVRLNDESEAPGIMTRFVEEIIETSLQAQPTVGDFMTAPVLSVRPDMNEKQVEDLFTRYDVRALPVVNEDNDVIGLVTYKEVAAAKQRMWNKEQKRLRKAAQEKIQGKKRKKMTEEDEQQAKKVADERRRRASTVKAWMKQHIKTVESSSTMAEVEAILLENDIGCIPVVADGTMQLVGMVTRTDLLRQHRYYPSLYYHNKGFSDSIAARKPIIELRKKLKRFDVEE